MILTSIKGLRWASMIFSLIEQGMIIDGELIQITSKKHLTPSDHFWEDQEEKKVP
jgi:hypothetical protein